MQSLSPNTSQEMNHKPIKLLVRPLRNPSAQLMRRGSD